MEIFNPKLVDEMRDRQLAYQSVFGGQDTPGRAFVLKDLAKFCRETESTFHTDQRVHALIEGRREVILRIRDFLSLPLEDLCKKYGKGQ